MDGERVTESGGTVIESEADLVLSATEVAVTVTDRFADTEPGAVYVVAAPLAVAAGATVPQGAVEHDTVQVTPLFEESLATVAVKLTVCPSSTLCDVVGETLTEIGGVADWLLAQPKLLAARNIVLKIASSEIRFFDLITTSHSDFAYALTGRGVIFFTVRPSGPANA